MTIAWLIFAGVILAGMVFVAIARGGKILRDAERDNNQHR